MSETDNNFKFGIMAKIIFSKKCSLIVSSWEVLRLFHKDNIINKIVKFAKTLNKQYNVYLNDYSIHRLMYSVHSSIHIIKLTF